MSKRIAKGHALSPIPPDLADLTWMAPLAGGGCQPAPHFLNVPQLCSFPEGGVQTRPCKPVHNIAIWCSAAGSHLVFLLLLLPNFQRDLFKPSVISCPCPPTNSSLKSQALHPDLEGPRLPGSLASTRAASCPCPFCISLWAFLHIKPQRLAPAGLSAWNALPTLRPPSGHLPQRLSLSTVPK